MMADSTASQVERATEREPDSRPGYSPQGYRVKLRTTRNRVLLVEGPSDKRAFRLLLREAVKAGVPVTNVTIDTAEQIRSPEDGRFGNRDKIVAVCEGMKESDEFPHFVAFVDREFRGFDPGALTDELCGHHVEGRLVWSRGHSVENYLFDATTLTETIESVALTDSAELAIELFQGLFNETFRLICALSLACKDLGFMTLVEGSIDGSAILLTGDTVELNFIGWKERLVEQCRGNSTDLPDRLVAAFERWLQALISAPNDLMRWMSHGHIGWTVMWIVYGRCLEVISGGNTETKRMLRVTKEIRQDVATKIWARLAIGEGMEYPRVVLEMLSTVNDD